MDTNNKPAMGNMALIGGIIVVIVIIAAAVLFLGGKKTTSINAIPATTVSTNSSVISGSNSTTANSNATTTMASNVTNATKTNTTTVNATTTVVANQSQNDFQSWQGKNLTLNQFTQAYGGQIYGKVSTLNETFDYNAKLALTGQYAFNVNTSGVSTVEIYHNDSRLTTSSKTSTGSTGANIIVITNGTSHKSYACNNISGSYICSVEAVNVSITNSTGGLNFVSGEAGSNVTVSGYFNNISVTSSSYNGQPCTLINGNLYVNSEAKNLTTKVVMSGKMSSCVATNSDALLSDNLMGNMAITSQGYTSNAMINYNESEVSMGSTPTAAITALPGPISAST